MEELIYDLTDNIDHWTYRVYSKFQKMNLALEDSRYTSAKTAIIVLISFYIFRQLIVKSEKLINNLKYIMVNCIDYKIKSLMKKNNVLNFIHAKNV